MASVSFYTGTDYALKNYSSGIPEGSLAFATDTRRVYYVGSGMAFYPYADEVYVNDTSSPKQGALYVDTVNQLVKVYNGSSFITVGNVSSLTTTQTVRPATGSDPADNDHVPTELATRAAIDGYLDEIKANPNVSPASGNSGKVPVLGSDGKLPNAYIPQYALSQLISGTFADLAAVVADFSADPPTASGDLGDYVVTQDGVTYILSSGDGTSSSNWTAIATPTEYTAGANITISGRTISATDTTYTDATTSASGLMSATDKTKLNGIESGANNYVLPTATASTASTPVKGGVMVDGTSITINNNGVISAAATPLEWQTIS